MQGVVYLPNRDSATVDEAKVRDYLLSPSHPVGCFKSVFFAALGFSVEDWHVLRDAFLELARSAEATQATPVPLGRSSRSMLDCKALQVVQPPS